MNGPIIIINFKTYANSIGEAAVKLAKICDAVAFETHTDIRIAVGATDISPVSAKISIPVYAEHVDPYPPDRHTGSILPEMIKTAGAKGTLINHSEHQVPMDAIAEGVGMCARLGLTSVVCADTPEKAEQIARLKPDFIAVEPPELIGGDLSVSSAHPEVISRSVEVVKKKHGVRLLVGAGVKTKEDIKKALELGADGVLIASGIDKAEDPEKTLMNLLS